MEQAALAPRTHQQTASNLSNKASVIPLISSAVSLSSRSTVSGTLAQLAFMIFNNSGEFENVTSQQNVINNSALFSLLILRLSL